MSRDGNGVYNLPVNSWNPAVDGNAATTVDWQSLIDDVATALTQSVSSDGQTPMTGDLNMNGNRIESLAAGTSTTDAANVGQIYNQGIEQDVASAGTTDIGIINSNFIRITGTTTITSLGINYRGPRFVRFAASLTLTHNATTLSIPGGANVTTSAGDRAIFVPKGNPSDGWICVVYQYASGRPITGYTLLKRTIVTATGTHNYDAFCRLKRIIAVGAGGAGGGAVVSVDGQASAGSGGGSGAAVDVLSLNTSSSASITVGAGGTASAGNDGGNSGTSSFTDSDTTISMTAATGGTVGSSNVNFFTRTGGDGGTASVSGTGVLNYTNRPGVRGGASWASGTGVNSRLVGFAGYGAACAGGTAAYGSVLSSTTNTGSVGADGDKGCGGGGATALRASGAFASTAGGAGGAAQFIIEEYA